MSVAWKGLDMAAPQAPDPDEPGGLSAREQKILAAIEADMLTPDPALARGLTGANRPRPGPRGWAAARHGVLLILALTALIVAAAVMPSDWWHVLGLLTTLLLVPWILLFPTDHPDQD